MRYGDGWLAPNRGSASAICSMRRWTAGSRECMFKARISSSPIRTPACHRGPQGHGMRRRSGPVYQRDARYAHVFLPGASFLEKDGTFTNAERRISRAEGDAAALRVRGLGGDLPGHRPWAMTCVIPIQAKSWTRSRASRQRSRVCHREAGPARLGTVAMQRPSAGGHPDHACRQDCPWQGQVHVDRVCRVR